MVQITTEPPAMAKLTTETADYTRKKGKERIHVTLRSVRGTLLSITSSKLFRLN